jgi:Recombination endonuclease VII
MKLCTKCNEIKPLSSFSESKSEKGYKQYRCKACNKEYREARKNIVKDYQLKYKFGISLDLYLQMLEEQNNACKICKSVCKTGRKLAVDHDHKTGNVRGLLCSKCNRALGLLNDDETILEEAIKYLKEQRKYGID